MKKARELRWGETPFDRMSHEDLLIHAKRMFLALTSLHSVVSQHKVSDEHFNKLNLPYWSNDGMGGKALNLSKRTLGKIKRGYNSDNIYRMFFRYAKDVLFEPDENASRWQVCDHCKMFLGTTDTACCFCKNRLRKLTMADLMNEPSS